ncbi:MAG: hypothetical protein R3232_01085 [Clostridia bacterium]|nr:hypothetical protein [Clostridia bacterium]
MNELVQKLMGNAKIDEATAKKVIATVKEFLDDKLPSPIDKKVANVLDGIDAEDVGNILGKAKGLFGKK